MKVWINGSLGSAWEGQQGDVVARRERHGGYLSVGVKFKDWPTNVYFCQKEVVPVVTAE